LLTLLLLLLLLLLLAHPQVSFNVANTPEQIYWNQKKVREAMAKAGGILPNSISYYQVRRAQRDVRLHQLEIYLLWYPRWYLYQQWHIGSSCPAPSATTR
jgi:hypothetical protein